MADNNSSSQNSNNKELIEKEAANLKAQREEIDKLREDYEKAQETDLNAAERARDENETKLIEENLDEILAGEKIEGLEYTITSPSTHFIEKVIKAATNSKDKETNIQLILLAIVNKEISAGTLSPTSRKMMIANLEDEPEFLKSFYRSTFVTPISGRVLIESIGENVKNLRPLVEVINADPDGTMVPIFQQLRGKTIAPLINTLGLKTLEKLITEDQKAQLLETNINEKDKKEIAKKIREKLKTDNKNINSFSANGIIAILKYIKEDKDKSLYNRAVEGLSADNKKSVKEVFGLRKEERQEEEKVKNPTNQEEQKEKTETKEDEKFDVEIGKKRIKFQINGVERSFLTKKYITKALGKLKTDAEKKLYCYKKLLDIIDKDGSMHKTVNGKPNPKYNKHNVAGGDNEKFEQSNEKLKADIARLEGVVSGKTTKEAPKATAKKAEVDAGEEKQSATAKPQEGEKKTPGEEKEEKTEKIEENLDAQVDDIAGAMVELQTMGVTMEQPKKLTIREFRALKEFATRMKNEMDKADNAVSLLYTLKEISETLKKALEKSEIKNLEFKYGKFQLPWKKALAFGFGDESDLLDKLLNIKKTQLAKQPKQYIQFYERSRTKFVDIENSAKTEVDKITSLKEYDRYVNENFSVNADVGALSEEEMVEQWPNMEGFKDVEITLTSPPFSQFREAVPKKVAAIISEWSNEKVEFAHIFKAADMFTGLDEKILPKKFVESSDEFKEEISRLQKNVSNLTPEEKTRLSYMFHYIYYPCIQLLKGIRRLKIKAKSTNAEEEAPREDNVQVIEGLQKFFTYTERSDGTFEHFLTAISVDGTSSVTMSDINGKKFVVDQGRLRRKFDPLAALKSLIKRPEMFKINETDEKVLDDKALTKEVNRLIRLGEANLNIRSKKKGDTGPLEVKTLKNTEFKPIQMELFQIGFLIDQASRFSKQVEEGIESQKEDTPAVAKILDDLVKKGVSPSLIPKIRKQLLLVAGAQFEEGKFQSALLGVPIKINESVSIKIGLGANTKGEVLAGVGASVEVYENGTFKVRAVAEVDVKGFTVGSSQSVELGMVNISAFEGFRWSWTSPLPTVGGGLMLAWNTEKQLKKDIAEKEKASGFKEAFDAWKKIPKGDVEKRYQELKKIKKIWDKVGPAQAVYKLTNADVVHIVENIQEDITDEALEDLSSSPIPLIASIGVGLVGGVPMPIVGFKLGSAKVSVPQRRQIAKILSTLSNARVEKDLKEALAKFDGKTEEMVVYKEVTGEIVYSREGLLMIKDAKNSTELDFASWKTDTLEGANDSLKKANMRIVIRELPNNRLELKILDTDNQDTEIYPDPLMQKLAIAKDKSKLIIEGNIKDLVISRERFTLPFKGSANVASIREKITVRQSTSVAGRRDSSWIEKNNKGFFQKLENEGEYHLYNGNKEGKNIFDKYEGNMEEFRKDRPKLKGKIGTKEVAAYNALITERNEALASLTAKDYSKQEVRKDLFTGLDSFYAEIMKTEKDPVGLYAKLSRRMDRPAEIIKFIKEQTKEHPVLKNLNDKETNLALMHILNKWFTVLYKKARTDKLAKKRLKTALKQRIEYFKREVFAPEIEKARTRINARRKDGQPEQIQASAEDLTNQLVDQVYGKLLKAIDSKGFKFEDLKVSPITEGATMVAASRFYREQSRDPMLAETVNYSTLSKDNALKHAFGFLEITRNPQKLGANNELARVMLEMASPLPIEDEKFLRSPFTLKLLSLKALVLIQGNRDFKLITEVIKKPELLQNFDGPHKQAFERFKDLAEDIRNAQIEGKTLKYTIKDTGLTVTLDMKASLESGAYAKCGNATFSAIETGTVTVTREETGKVVGVFKQTDEVIDARLDKIFASIAITGINTKKIRPKKDPEPTTTPKPKPQPKPVGGKKSAEGGGESPSQAAPSHTAPIKIDANGTVECVESGPGSAGVASGSHDQGQSQTL